VLHRIIVRSAADPTHRNKRVTFKSDVQETLDKLDTIHGALRPSDNQPKQRSRKRSDEVSNKTRSKIGSIDQNIGDRTRSKIQFTHKVFKALSFDCMMQLRLKTTGRYRILIYN
jgi:hypothetical protein